MASIEVMNVKQTNPEAPIEIQLSTSNITYRGPKGDQGPAGPAGRDGAVGYDGKSAYELAVDNGFEGTEVEWLASLKGETGATGPAGAQGPKGDQGIQGPQGETGATGPAGAQGPAGQNGTTPVKGTDYFTQQDIADIVAQVPATDIKFLMSSGSGSSTGTSSTLLSGLSAADKTYLLDAYNDQLKNTRYFVIQDTSGALFYPLTTYSMRLVFLGGVNFQNYYYLKFDDTPGSATTIQKWDKEDVVPNWGAIKAGSTAADPFNNSANTSVADAFSYINTNFATKSYVENIVRAAQTGMLKRQVVQALPQSDIDDYTIYMVPKTGSTGDVYNEFLYMDNTWELIGNTQVDLTGYATEAYVNTAVGAISGGTTYTAGTGISIDSNDVISANMNPLIHSMLQMTTAGNDMPGVIRLTNTSTWEEFVDNVKAGKIVYVAASTSYTFSADYKLTPALLGITTLRALNIDAYSLALMSPSVSSYPATGTQIYYQTYYYFDGDFLWSWKKPEDLGNFIKVHYRNSNNTALGYALKQITDSIDGITGLPTPSTTDGTYKLNCAVSSGSPTYSWTSDSGSGGGTTYTAGNGISISANDEISNSRTSLFPLSFFGNSSTLMNAYAISASGMTWDELLANLRAGKIISTNNVSETWIYSNANQLNATSLLGDANAKFFVADLNGSPSQNFYQTTTYVYQNRGYYFDGVVVYTWVNGYDWSNWIDVRYGNTTQKLKDVLSSLSTKLPAPSSTDGTYKLNCSVSSGSPTYSWATDSGGGGSSYTAGRGISISNNNEISAYPLSNFAPLWSSLLGYSFSPSQGPFGQSAIQLSSGASVDDFISALQAGKMVWVSSVPSSWTGCGTALMNMGINDWANVKDGDTWGNPMTLTADWRPPQVGIFWINNNTLLRATPNGNGRMLKNLPDSLFYNNANSNLSAYTIKGAIDELAGKLPTPSTTDGTYVLQCVVSNGTPTYSWVSAS